VFADQKTHLAQYICATLNCIAVVKYHEYSRSTDDSDEELLDEVGELLAEALAIRATTSGDMKQVLRRDTATILNNMGRYNFQREEFAEALEFYNEAYECRRIILGDNHWDVATTLFNIAQTHAELSNTTEAISSYKKFISIGILTLGENHLDISNVRFIVGQLCHTNNDLEGAFEHLTLALKSSRTAVGGPDDETIALVLNKLGNVLYDQNNMKAALDAYEEGLTVERRIYPVYSQHISVTLMNIALAHQENGNLVEAIKSMKEAAQICTEKSEIMGSQRHTSDVFRLLGNLYAQIGDIGKAVETYAVATRLHKPQSHNLDASGLIGKHYFTLKMMDQLVTRAAAAA